MSARAEQEVERIMFERRRDVARAVAHAADALMKPRPPGTVCIYAYVQGTKLDLLGGPGYYSLMSCEPPYTLQCNVMKDEAEVVEFIMAQEV